MNAWLSFSAHNYQSELFPDTSPRPGGRVRLFLESIQHDLHRLHHRGDSTAIRCSRGFHFRRRSDGEWSFQSRLFKPRTNHRSLEEISRGAPRGGNVRGGSAGPEGKLLPPPSSLGSDRCGRTINGSCRLAGRILDAGAGRSGGSLTFLSRSCGAGGIGGRSLTGGSRREIRWARRVHVLKIDLPRAHREAQREMADLLLNFVQPYLR